MQGALSRLHSWELDRKEDDVRGWALRDMEGRTLGNVGDLIVDTDTRTVIRVVLGDGRQYAASQVFLGDRFLTLSRPQKRDPAIRETRTESSTQTEAAARASESADPTKIESRPLVANRDFDLVVPIIEEELEVSKRRYETGGIRVDAHVVTKPVEQDVRLTEERVHVERKPVDLPLTPTAAAARLHDATVEMAAMSELPVVDKVAQVVEEVVVKKEVTERVQVIRDTVRHTDAQVTKLPGTELSVKGAVR